MASFAGVLAAGQYSLSMLTLKCKLAAEQLLEDAFDDADVNAKHAIC